MMATLPGLYHDDGVAVALCAGLDEVLASALVSLDNFASYLDLRTTPEDMIPWLASWVGLTIESGIAPERQRELLRAASETQGWAGTARGMELAVEALFGMPTEVIESGAAAYSMRAGDALPGEPLSAVVVRVTATDPSAVDLVRLEAVVDALKPAHAMHRIQVVAGD
jgi:phage tail-like protein